MVTFRRNSNPGCRKMTTLSYGSIGTSGAVYPAAGFVQTARYRGAQTLEINLEPSLGSIMFDESRIGRAGELVPQWVEEVLAT